MGKNTEGSGRGQILRRYPGMCLEGLKNTTKNVSQVSRSLGRYLNSGPSDYEAGVLPSQLRRLFPVSILLKEGNYVF
jgi:hypothetical protein